MAATLPPRKQPPDPLYAFSAALCSLWLALIALCAEGFFLHPNVGDIAWGAFDAAQFRALYDEIR